METDIITIKCPECGSKNFSVIYVDNVLTSGICSECGLKKNSFLGVAKFYSQQLEKDHEKQQAKYNGFFRIGKFQIPKSRTVDKVYAALENLDGEAHRKEIAAEAGKLCNLTEEDLSVMHSGGYDTKWENNVCWVLSALKSIGKVRNDEINLNGIWHIIG